MRISSLGQTVLATTIVALGIQGLIQGDFAAIWQPVPKSLPARDVLAYVCAFVLLGTGMGLLWQRIAAAAARVLLVYLLLWLLLLRLPDTFPAPTVLGSWYGCAETTVIMAAVWVLYAWLAPGLDRRRLHFATGDQGVRIARMFYGITLVFFGASHFIYLDLTTPLVPGWLPAHTFWAYFFGCTYIAAGMAVLARAYARLAVALSALQMGLFTLLVWVPLVAASHTSASNWHELVISWTLTASAWVMADSYRDVAWLAVRKR